MCGRRLLIALPPALLGAAPAAAHAPAGADPAVWSWTTDPLVLVPILVLGIGYAVGVARLWGRAGAGRGVPVARALAFALGFAALFVALVSPLDAAGESVFSLHMTQHMLLVVVAAPLMALGNGGVVLLSALPARARVPVGRSFAAPALRSARTWLFAAPTATVLHGLTLWAWHAPAAYEAALASEFVHYLEHLTMFGTGMVFWWSMLTTRGRSTLRQGAGVGALFVTMIHTGLLGILITLAPHPLYPTYASTGALGGFTPLEDQQLAGIVMLIPGGLAYLLGGLGLLAALLNSADRRRPAGV